MVIKPEEAMKIKEDEIEQIRKMQIEIDNALKEHFRHFKDKKIIYAVEDAPSQRVLDNIKELYESNGWLVKICFAQMDGTWIEFTPKKELFFTRLNKIVDPCDVYKEGDLVPITDRDVTLLKNKLHKFSDELSEDQKEEILKTGKLKK